LAVSSAWVAVAFIHVEYVAAAAAIDVDAGPCQLAPASPDITEE
jgi:hypothetical protein